MPHLNGGFGFEESWLRKGLKEYITDNSIFNVSQLEKAQMLLELGTHQIKDLKDWLIAANLLFVPKKNLILSPIGSIIFNYDKEFSEDGTFWIIHNYLSLNVNIKHDRLWVYYWYVNEFENEIFSNDDLLNGILRYQTTTDKIVKRFFITPLLQTFRKSRLGKSFGMLLEDMPNQFKRIEPPEDKLDPVIVAYITMDWAKKNERSSANLLELTTLKCSPGKTLHLSSSRYAEYLDKIQAIFNKEILWVSYTAGLNSVSFEKDINPLDILKAYYIKKSDEISPIDSYYKAKKESYA